MKTLLDFLSSLIVFVLISVVAVMTFWSVYPYKVIEFKDEVYPIHTKTVERGGTLVYEVNACKYTSLSPSITKYFVDGVVYETPKVYGVVDPGCRKTDVAMYVPLALPLGEYKVKLIIHYKVNPIRTVEFTNYTETFTIE